MPIQIDELEQAIYSAFPVSHLHIEDQSSGCGDSYSVLLVSDVFEGKTTLARHRLINETLKEQIAQMHAFSQKTFTPKQYETYLAKGKA
ncbi:bola protein [Phlebopus sp. FC_14]|nr:bola protein [Phlebopus sp. FC_14]